MKKVLKKISSFVAKTISLFISIAILCLSIALTGYVYANSYEILFNKDLQYSSSIEKFHATNLLQGIKLDNSRSEINLSGNEIGDYGKPQVINFSSLNKRLSLVPAIISESEWMTRSNNGHFFVTYKDNQDLESILVYMRQSWRTIDTPENVVVGQNIFIDTDKEWKYMFRIEEIVKLDFDGKYVISDKKETQLIVLIEDEKENLVYLIRGSYVTVINN